MKQLTMRQKKLTREGKDNAIDLKWSMFQQANQRCFKCGELLPFTSSQLAHIINKGKTNIEKYSLEVIHHPLNMRISCKNCNSYAMIGTSRKQAIKEHLEPILADLKQQGYDILKVKEIVDREAGV